MTASEHVAHEESARVQNKEAIIKTMEEYVAAYPERRGFTFFLLSRRDLEAIKQAAATISIRTGKPIDLIYPCDRLTEINTRD